GQCWVAISDYGSGRWKFLGALAGPGGFDLPPGTYTAGGGSFFMLLVTFNGDIAKHNFTIARFDDGTVQGAQISGTVTDENSQPGMPTALTSSPLAASRRSRSAAL